MYSSECMQSLALKIKYNINAYYVNMQSAATSRERRMHLFFFAASLQKVEYQILPFLVIRHSAKTLPGHKYILPTTEKIVVWNKTFRSPTFQDGWQAAVRSGRLLLQSYERITIDKFKTGNTYV